MELVTEILPRFSVKQAVYTQVEVTSPWGFDFIPYRHTKFGVVTEGECFIDLKNNESPIHLRKGSCYLLTRGDAFRLRDPALSTPVDFELALKHLDGRVLRWGGGGEKTVVIGGRFIFSDDRYPLLLDLLPSLMHFRVNDSELDMLVATIRLLANETQSSAFGSRAMIDRLADIFFIQSLRAYLSSSDDNHANVEWLGSVSDERLSRAVRLIHSESERAWTIASLATSVGMSRAVFASRFKATLGVAPMTYLTQHRLVKAQQLLQNSSMSVAQVAQRVGYESEAAFNKVFKRMIGYTPSVFRKSRQVAM